MSPSGVELLRQVKSQIEEVDPSEVKELVDEGVAIVDVRETDEFAAGHLPGAKHVPRSYLESRIEGVVPDRSTQVILYCQSGNRSAWATRTLVEELGYEHVRSMTGGITLWKDRGYEVVVPRALTAEQRDRYSRHVLIPEIGIEGQQKLLDDASVRLRIPVVSASILGFDGQLSIFKPYDGPCYRCLFREPPPAELAPSCGANGVLGVLPGTMGLLQATEVVKLILDIGEPAIGRLLLYDALGATLTEVKVHRDPDCPICSRAPEAISDDELGVFPDYEAFCAGAH